MSRRPVVSIGGGATSGTSGFWGLLTILLIALKLLHKIAWSWVWVLAPLWIGTAVSVVILLIVLLALFVFTRNR